MMKNLFLDYISDPDWLITEKAYDQEFLSVNESQFALGNGYLGSRGIYEEIPNGSQPGTFFAGIFDPVASKVSELVNAPNPFDLRIAVHQGEKLSITSMDVEDNKRILDMRHAALFRHTVYRSHDGKHYDYQSLRYIAMNNLNLAVMQVALTPLDEATQFNVNSTINTSVLNRGFLFEGDTQHFHIYEAQKEDTVNYLAVKTLAHEIVIGYAHQMTLQQGENVENIKRRKFDLKLQQGETVVLTKYVTFCHSHEVEPSKVKRKTINLLKKAVKAGPDLLIKQHILAMKKRWKILDIEIEGDGEAQTGMRFNLYHLLITAHPNVPNVSVGAKALSGEGYRGHIFWDTEILLLPAYALTEPKVARNLLDYRYNRLDTAKQIASSRGYKGAMYPWESAETGLDETPFWMRQFDGTIGFVHTGKQEHHITADVFYAMYFYFNVTGDVEFMLRQGVAILIETTRFWMSRLEYNSEDDQYEINHVIGPDEFHEDINNNAYTNVIVAWQLRTAHKIIEQLQKQCNAEVNAILEAFEWDEQEGQQWHDVSKKIKLIYYPGGKIIEQFDDFCQLQEYPLPTLDEYGMPTLPKEVEVRNLSKTQFIKQADVVMLFLILPDLFEPDVSKQNYMFYEKRTLHKSSLSAGPHATVGAELGFTERAYHYFTVSMNSDRRNIYRNTHEGIHAAALGGSWQAVIYGFCGVRYLNECLSVAPQLPAAWRSVNFKLAFRGYLLHFKIDHRFIKIKATGSVDLKWLTRQPYFEKLSEIPVKICGELHYLKIDQRYRFDMPIERRHKYQSMEGLL